MNEIRLLDYSPDGLALRDLKKIKLSTTSNNVQVASVEIQTSVATFSVDVSLQCTTPNVQTCEVADSMFFKTGTKKSLRSITAKIIGSQHYLCSL